jgi:hypothetical protein
MFLSCIVITVSITFYRRVVNLFVEKIFTRASVLSSAVILEDKFEFIFVLILAGKVSVTFLAYNAPTGI